MRLVFVSFITLLIINGCSNSINPLTPVSESSLEGNLEYTFSSLKYSYETSDTLTGSVVVKNIGTQTDTIDVGDGIFQWYLLDENGKVILRGGGNNNSLTVTTIKPGESKEIYQIYHSFGKTVVSGPYKLKATLYPEMAFSLSLIVN